MGLRTPPIDVFGARRSRVKQQQTAQTQEEMDALKRRLASLGGLDTGAAIKVEQQQQEKAAQRMQGALSDVDVQEQEFLLQQQEAEKQRQFAAGESALERRLRESMLGTQLGAEEKRLGQQLGSARELAGLQTGSAEKIAGLQIGSAEKLQMSQQQFQGLENRLGREAAVQLQNIQNDQSTKLKNMDAEMAKAGRLSQESMNNANIKSQENMANLQRNYLQAKDKADRGIIEKQMKNEMTFALMTQAVDLAQMGKMGLKPSEVASMMSWLEDFITIDPETGDALYNPNATAPVVAEKTGYTGLPPATTTTPRGRPY